MKRFEVTVFLSGEGVPDKFIQMSLQIVISMYFQVVISSSSCVSTIYFQVHVLTRSYTFNGNDVGALHKRFAKKGS